LLSVTEDSNLLDALVAQVEDETLRSRLSREIELLRGSREFGLVFDRHLPESVRLPEHPVRKGVRVALRDESVPGQAWRVIRFTDSSRKAAVLDGDGGEVPVEELVVIREFGEPVYPGLRSVERIANGSEDAPWHTVINGENFHVLQALRSTHREKVDLIYIDPPYNTGNDGWIYNDRYVDTNDRAKSSKWLSFLEKRLTIARDLLKPTGVIIVAIDDGEQARLKLLMDQVFGHSNFIANVVWQGGFRSDAKYVATGHDYMLVYCKDEAALVDAGIRWRERKPGLDEALAQAKRVWDAAGGDHAGATKAWRAWMREFKVRGHVSDAVTRYTSLDEATGEPIYTGQNLSSPNPRPNLQYDLLHPITGRPVRRHPNGWRYSREQMDALVDQGRVRFGPDEKSGAQGVSFLSEFETQVAKSFFEADRRGATKRLVDVLGDKRFPFPKDHTVLMRWISLTVPTGAVVLDFFGGSGTTTEAVTRLNAEDGGTRQSILVTNNEVGSKQAKELRKAGHHPGDPEWETKGVFEYVTRPRISTVVTGKRPDGSAYSDGLPANVEFLDLTYLDPGMVRRGREFQAIAPLLWLRAGAVGERIDSIPETGWALTQSYGVLFDLDGLAQFAAAVADVTIGGAAPVLLFVVTDSETEYQHAVERLPVGIETVQLYEDYLSNFTVNVEGGVR
jgi:adenine-specific DNA-methyltransferase